jgi:hypothetical protein
MRRTAGAAIGTGVALLALATACAPAAEKPSAPAELDTVDVTAAPDAALSTASDAQERRQAPAFAGALPDGFPGDLPVVKPSSLVDFAEAPEGGFVASFDTTEAPAAARAFLEGRLRAAGFRDAGGGTWTKPGRQVVLTLQPTGAGSRFTYRY